MNIEGLEITKIERKDGVFETEQGRKIEYRNYYVYFKKEGYPLEFRAKLDRLFGEYIEEVCDAE